MSLNNRGRSPSRASPPHSASNSPGRRQQHHQQEHHTAGKAEAAVLLGCSAKNIDAVMQQECTLSHARVSGFVRRLEGGGDGALLVTTVDNAELAEPLLVHGALAKRHAISDFEAPAFAATPPPTAVAAVLQRSLGAGGVAVTLFKLHDKRIAAKCVHAMLFDRALAACVQLALASDACELTGVLSRDDVLSATVVVHGASMQRDPLDLQFVQGDVGVHPLHYTLTDGRSVPFYCEVSCDAGAADADAALALCGAAHIGDGGLNARAPLATIRVNELERVPALARAVMTEAQACNARHRLTRTGSEDVCYDCGNLVVAGALLYWLDADGYIVGSVERVWAADVHTLLWKNFDMPLVKRVRDALPQLAIIDADSQPPASAGAAAVAAATHHAPPPMLDASRARVALALTPSEWRRFGASISALVRVMVHPAPPLTTSNIDHARNVDDAATEADGSLSPRLIVTVGSVGGGKSYFAQRLADAGQGAWVRANQDDLGSRDAVAHRSRSALLAGASVIIDRTNIDVAQRRTWFELAAACGIPRARIHALWFDVPAARSATRLAARVDHPTLSASNTELAHRVLHTFAQALVPPTVEEGFARVHVVRSDADAEAMLQRVLRLNR